MTPEQFFYKIKGMRDDPKEYFKFRNKSALEKSKRIEAEIDNEIKRTIQIKTERQHQIYSKHYG